MPIIKTINLALASTKNIISNVQSQPFDAIQKINNPLSIADDKFFVSSQNKKGNVIVKDLKIDSFLNPKTVSEATKAVATTSAKISAGTEKQIILNKFSKIAETNLVASSDDIKEDVNKYTAFELLTGISEIRPQIISLTEFKPLLEDSGLRGNAKNYFDLQFFLRNLKFENFQQIVKTTSKDANFRTKLFDVVFDNKQAILDFQKYANNLLSVVFAIDVYSASLDLRDEKKSAEIQFIIDKYISSYTSNKSLAAFIRSAHPIKYSVIDVLTSLGYYRENISAYTNTKVWMQLLYELKTAFRDHSSVMLDNRSVDKNLDASSFALIKNDVEKFNLATKQPTLISLNVLKDVQVNDINQTLNIIKNAYSNLYTSAKFIEDQHKIVAFLNLISKEYRYSAALSQAVTIAMLKSKFNFTVKPSGNSDLFDAIFGTFGDNITNVAPENNTTLIGFSTQATQNRATLMLENDYIIAGNSQLVPGVEQTVDSIFDIGDAKQLNVNNLQSFLNSTEKYIESFSIVTNQLDFVLNDPEPTNPQNINALQQLSNPKLLFDKIFSALVDKNGKSLSTITSDVVASIFKFAEINNTLKSLLFLYFIVKVSRTSSISIPFFSTGVSSDNTATIQKIVDLIMIELENSLKNYHKDRNVSADDIVTAVSVQNIRDLFITANSKLLKFVFELFILSITELQRENIVTDSSNNSTRYSGHLDTAISMAFFDFLLSCINSVSKQEFLGRDNDVSKGNRYLSFQQISTSKTSKNKVISIKSRINKEIVLCQQMFFTNLNMLNSVKNSAQNLINKATNERINTTIREIYRLFEFERNRKVLLQKFFEKQQILLFAKQIHDISTRIEDQKNSTSDLTIFDENYLSIKEFLAISKLFGTDDFKDESKNRRILTVGIPTGFVKKLHRSLNTNSSRQKNLRNKQDDIINILVYKIDGKNANLIFKPQKFKFEMSRFVTRGDSVILNSANNPVANFPTIDISSGNIAEYIDNSANKNITRFAFQDNSYSFLSSAEKKQLYTNHVYSYALEKYMSLITGLSIHESTFPLIKKSYVIEPAILLSLMQLELSALTNKKADVNHSVINTNVLFSSEPTALTKDIVPINENINNLLSQKDIGVITNVITLVNDIKTIGSTLSKKDTIKSKVIMPKKFDRVFNVLLDTEKFYVDKEATENSQVGKIAFANLLNDQKLVLQTDGEYLLQRNKDEIIFDKYFVAIEADDGVTR